ncbi:MAG: FAD-dependent oxidoreductase [Candidatus Lokiarchaeota archaeon]|nr:FAD-dependent oxidoreductase [Candidatus Lokiarchaeota archaeon]MBD3342216.1 FAD-dependent oxidoreductase [Candidatus Lokiarchaeota archaeon]
MNKKFKYIIVGGGIAGLHIGALLSQHGRTLVLEKTAQIGGRAKVNEIKGFKLDFGPHPIRFGPKSDLAKSLREINKPIEFIKPGDFWAFLDDGTKTIFPAGGVEQIKNSKMVPFKETMALIVKIMSKMKSKDFEALYNVSLKDWWNQENLSLELRKFLKMVSSSIQVNPFPERSSAGEILENIKNVLKKGSIFYPKGGWNEIFRRFKEKIEDNGEIKLKTEVEEIILEDSKAVGVRTKENTFFGKLIVSTIPVQQLFTILDKSKCDQNFVLKCKELRPTAGISIDYCLPHRITEKDFIFFEKPLAFGFVPSNLSPEIVPEGYSLMSFFRAVNVEDIEEKTQANKLCEELKNTIYRFFPSIKKEKIYERILFFPMVDGVEVNIHQHRLNRPGNRMPNIKNFFITGDSCGGSGAGGDVGHTSVREGYKNILKS